MTVRNIRKATKNRNKMYNFQTNSGGEGTIAQRELN